MKNTRAKGVKEKIEGVEEYVHVYMYISFVA